MSRADKLKQTNEITKKVFEEYIADSKKNVWICCMVYY